MNKLAQIVDRAGDSNPQLFREFKERLTVRNVSLALICTAIVQGFVLIYFNGQIPIPAYAGISSEKLIEVHSSYCEFAASSSYDESLCRLGMNGGFNINWQKWWLDVFSCLSWILPLGLILGAVYTLVSDLVREEKRGTLNFIRLSPQLARTIFGGKIIGVPILTYLAIAAILPLHFLAGINAGGNIFLLFSWYVAIGSLSFLFASAAVLYVLLGGFQAILTVIAVAYPVLMPLFAINTFAIKTIEGRDGFGSDSLRWFWLPITSNAVWFYTFEIGCCLVASYWIWQILERRYLNPTATIVSKSQSYRLNLCWQLWIAGFALPAIFGGSRDYSYVSSGAAYWFSAIDFAALLLLIPLLLPSKQALQDWSRYRRERVTHQRKFWQRELIKDLIGNDKSPAILAIAINLGMALLLWLPLSIFAFDRFLAIGQFVAGVCIAVSLIAIYAAIAHLSLFVNFKQRKTWTIGSVGATMFLPMVGAFVLSSNSTPTGLAAILLIFSPLVAIGIPQLSMGTILAAFCAQLGIFAFLTRQLQRKLQQSGQSQTKALTPNNSI
jgi:hypothetical protein